MSSKAKPLENKKLISQKNPPPKAVDEEEDDDDEEDDEDFVGGDSDDSDASSVGSDAKNGAGSRRKRSDDGGKAKKRGRAEGLSLAGLEALDADELAHLREDAVERYGADVLGDKSGGKGDGLPDEEESRQKAAGDLLARMLEEDRNTGKGKASKFGLFSAAGTSSQAPGVAKDSSQRAGAPASASKQAGSSSSAASLKQIAASKASTEADKEQRIDAVLAGLHCGPARKVAETEGGAGKPAVQRKGAASAEGDKSNPAAIARALRLIPGLSAAGVSTSEIAGTSGSGSGSSRSSGSGGRGVPAGARAGQVDRFALLAAAAAARAAAGSKKIAVQQTVMFAGKQVQVTKMVDRNEAAAMQGTAAGASSASASSSAGGEPGAGSSGPPAPRASLASLVASLDKPEAISTLAKTSLDWDTYKAKEGLEDDFTAAARGAGFVEKQALLARLGDRQDELDRQRRVEERKARESAGMGAGGRK